MMARMVSAAQNMSLLRPSADAIRARPSYRTRRRADGVTAPYAHQGLGPWAPEERATVTPRIATRGNVRAIPILGGLHHAYQHAA